ncbi:hypothetical protein [Camelimonas lactis]|uniref:Uncharacterized protein n=1 Tax=Camelimonas lactis TaxID=659006 RepID=A0A4V2RXH2_9HYPH|nr:hypothetical protein [Camelimonas lactis]TCO14068.1 hypothetical protein EV666_10418 [Camelimonas lactis]
MKITHKASAHPHFAIPNDYDVTAAITRDGFYCVGEERLARGEITTEAFAKFIGDSIRRKLDRWRAEREASGISSH